LAVGDDKTCTITNSDVQLMLSSSRRHTSSDRDWSSDVCSTDLVKNAGVDVTGSPHAGQASPGTGFNLSAGTYAVSENTPPAGYRSEERRVGRERSSPITPAVGDDKT